MSFRCAVRRPARSLTLRGWMVHGDGFLSTTLDDVDRHHKSAEILAQPPRLKKRHQEIVTGGCDRFFSARSVYIGVRRYADECIKRRVDE